MITTVHTRFLFCCFFLFRIYARSSDISVHYSVLFLSISHDVNSFLFFKKGAPSFRWVGACTMTVLSGFLTEFPGDMTFFAPAHNIFFFSLPFPCALGYRAICSTTIKNPVYYAVCACNYVRLCSPSLVRASMAYRR
jgi:hypothetical protein